MADNSGLILGLSEGIKSAMGAYNDERERQMRIQNYAIDRKMKKAAMELQAKEKGMTYNDETGDLLTDTDPNNPYNVKRREDEFEKASGLLGKGMTKDPVTGKPVFTPEKTEEMQTDIDYKKSQTAKNKKDLTSPSRLTDPELKAGTDLRKEYQARPEIKNFNEVSTQYKKIQKVAQNPSAAGDLSLIFAYMKMLDPGSTVREGEFANAQNAAGVPDQVMNMYNRAKNGERLNPKQRQDFLSNAERVYGSHLSSKEEIDAEFDDLSKRYKVDSGLIRTRPTGLIDKKTGGGENIPAGAPPPGKDPLFDAWLKNSVGGKK